MGILARIAPQMNMFVIGMQLKIFVGLVVLYFVMNLLPGLCDFYFSGDAGFDRYVCKINHAIVAIVLYLLFYGKWFILFDKGESI